MSHVTFSFFLVICTLVLKGHQQGLLCVPGLFDIRNSNVLEWIKNDSVNQIIPNSLIYLGARYWYMTHLHFRMSSGSGMIPESSISINSSEKIIVLVSGCTSFFFHFIYDALAFQNESRNQIGFNQGALIWCSSYIYFTFCVCKILQLKFNQSNHWISESESKWINYSEFKRIWMYYCLFFMVSTQISSRANQLDSEFDSESKWIKYLYLRSRRVRLLDLLLHFGCVCDTFLSF